MAIANTEVRHFRWSHSDAPALAASSGTIYNIIKKCLVEGYGSVTLTSLSVTSGLATATVSGGHGFVATGTTKPVIRIAGATPSGLNADWRIATITSSTEFTFVSDTADGSATGTITAKIAPLGWEEQYSGTNSGMFRSVAVGATGAVLYVVDSGAGAAVAECYETATDATTGVDKWSTDVATWYIHKGVTGSYWTLVGDDRFFILITHTTASLTTGYEHLMVFGDYLTEPFTASHSFPACFRSTASSLNTNSDSGTLGTVASSALARSYTGSKGGILSPLWYGHSASSTVFGATSTPYPPLTANELLYAQIELWQTLAAGPVGLVPGLFTAIHSNLNPTYTNTVFGGAGAQSGRELFCSRLTGTAARACLIDITGPWR
jgi:hypothetical protein